ncbi:PREDICTED: PH domain-containing protein DDB_G0287875 [Brassica oleracea var. oleracea]|uniref:PH domain-containing protein DDB_G0287875 n=1 Tax=Brassica oleracea var. oleracea TaxID=109376 RepID=UPI0006A74553|nr:PREDICTED: PH domain-containing protein DDB_G0287875 [Brassica oleracea var. oleracea]
MGESACLMQPFSYAAPQGDSLGALGQSVSFGRFMSERLDWEKWSSFPTQNRYVAEAERYSRPGSVAQKKAFFEAHYKNLAAARKAAAEEALLLRQQTSDELVPVQEEDINGVGKKESDPPVPEIPRASLDAEMKVVAEKVSRSSGNRQSDEKENRRKTESEINGKGSTVKEEQQVEEKTPMILLKKNSKEAQPKSSTKPRVSKLNISERTPSQKPSNKSSSYNFTPAKEFNRLVSIIRKIDGSSRASSKQTKECKTPLRTPSSNNKVSAKGIVEDSLFTTPLSSNRRAPDSSTKTGRGRWNFLPAETPSCFTPFGLRTEERAERRKKKLEEKFKAMEAQKEKEEEQERSVEKEESKLRQRLCFKAKQLPNFYKHRPKSTDQTKKALLR